MLLILFTIVLFLDLCITRSEVKMFVPVDISFCVDIMSWVVGRSRYAAGKTSAIFILSLWERLSNCEKSW